MSSDLIKHVSDASFETDVLASASPVLVDFWAEWCGPCKMFAPILDDVAKETPARFGIRGIPTVILYKNGQPHAQSVGAMSKSKLTQFLDSNL